MARKRTTKDEIRNTNHVYAVILVGGKGKRLRPLSTDSRPKAFLSVSKNRKTMFRNTVERAAKIIPRDNIVVVANRRHSRLVRKDSPGIKRSNLLLEHVSRNTAPAVILATSVIGRRDKDAVIAVLPTDHYIPNEKRQLQCLKRGMDFIREKRQGVVVLGLKPKYPSAQFGYIRVSASAKASADKKGHPSTPLGTGGSAFKGGIYAVERFIEKPDIKTAKRYLKSGKYLWNAGIFIFNAQNLLDAVKKYAPKIFHALSAAKITKGLYAKLPDISFDRAVMERARNIYCVSGSYGWNDMGSFDALKKVLMRESRRFVEKDGRIIKIL